MGTDESSSGRGRCELCGRVVAQRTKHHLIPRSRHKSKKNKKRFSRDEVTRRVAWLCEPCHDAIHATLSEKELESQFNTVADLSAHPEVASFVKWLLAHPRTRRLRVRRTTRRR